MNDSQLAKLRKSRRKHHIDTIVKVTVHTQPELIRKYYDEASPIQVTKQREEAFKERSPKISKSPLRVRSEKDSRSIKSTPKRK